MPESKHERIAAKIVTELESIVGDGGANYWYTPDKVIRTHDTTHELFDAQFDVIYALIPDVEEVIEKSAFELDVIARIDLMLAHAHTTDDQHYLEEEPRRWTVQNRMVRDVKKKLLPLVPPLGGLVDNFEMNPIELSADATYKRGWAVAMVRLSAHYSHAASEP